MDLCRGNDVLTPGLGVTHIYSACLIRKLNTLCEVCFSDLNVVSLLLPVDHGEVAKDLTIVWLLLQRRFKTILCGSQVALLPVNVAKSIPCITLRGDKLK